MARPPKRNLEGDFLTPSRRPVDSAIANGSDSTVERSIEQELADVRRMLTNLRFTSQRASGYSDVRSSQDLCVDLTDTNQDQELIQKTAYLKDQDRSLYGAEGYGRSGGVFAGDVNTVAKEMDEALEAARDMAVEAEGESVEVQAAMLNDLRETYPELFVADKTELVGNPLVKIAQRMSKAMNESTLAGQRRARRSHAGKRTQNFY